VTVTEDRLSTAAMQVPGVASEPEATVIPSRPDPATTPPPPRRELHKLSRESVLVTCGSFLSAFCTTALLFGRLTPLSGTFGFIFVFFIVYLATYAVLVSLTEDRPAVVDRVMTALMTAAALLAGIALASVVLSTIWKGRHALTKLNLYTEDMSTTGPLQPLSDGGIKHAIVGTLIIIGISLVLTVPLAITCAVFLNETHSRLAESVRTVVTAMTALPSIVAGLFIFATWILILGWPRSGLAAAITVSLMMLPIITRSADVVLRLVPGNLREASAALGAPHWRTVWHVVLPTARSGLATAVILGVARGVGETAPVLLTSGIGATLNLDPLKNPMMSLPLATYEFVRSPQPTQIARGFATAAVLMIVVLVLFSLARIVGGRPAGRLSKRQARHAEQRSVSDLQRIQGHRSAGAATAATAPEAVFR
jgi:phosphate transport system permease protein